MNNATTPAKLLQNAAQNAEKFGARSAYICSVYEQMPIGYRNANDLESFKADLVKWQRWGWVGLRRADLVKAMDSEMLRASETVLESKWGDATFHFVEVAAIIDSKLPGNARSMQ